MVIVLHKTLGLRTGGRKTGKRTIFEQTLYLEKVMRTSKHKYLKGQ